MAKKNEPDFDADSFIESVRQSSVPTYHTANDLSEPQPEKNKKKPKEQKSASVLSEGATFPDPEVEQAEKYASYDLSDDETDYIRTFLEPNNFRQINRLGSPIVIRNTYIEIIRSIIKLQIGNVRVAAYIDNVLLEHFRQHFPTIQGVFKKCPSKIL